MVFRECSGTPLQYSCLENLMDGGAWLAAVHGVAKSRTPPSYFTFTFHFHALEKAMATHSSTLAWRIPGLAEPGGLPSQFSGTLLKRTRCPDTSLKATLWMKAQHEGALTPLCIVRKNPQVPHTAQQVACHSVNNSKGKRRSIPPRKTRRDSLVRTRRVLCDPSQKWRGPLRFLPPFEMRPSSIAPNPVE